MIILRWRRLDTWNHNGPTQKTATETTYENRFRKGTQVPAHSLRCPYIPGYVLVSNFSVDVTAAQLLCGQCHSGVCFFNESHNHQSFSTSAASHLYHCRHFWFPCSRNCLLAGEKREGHINSPATNLKTASLNNQLVVSF